MIRDQGDRQLDLIGNFNTGTKSTGFENKRLSKLKKEIDDKESEVVENKIIEKQKERDKVAFNFTASDRTPYYFSDYLCLMKFAQNIYTGKFSFEKAEEEQKKMLSKIEQLEKRSKSASGRLRDDNREKMNVVAKNASDIYNFRNKIISTNKKEMGKHIYEDEKKVDLDDLLYAGVKKLIGLKNEYDSENEKFKKDHNIKKGRNALKEFIDNTLDGKFTDKKDCSSKNI